MITPIWTALHAAIAAVWAWLSSWAYTAHVLGSTAGLAAIAGVTIAAAITYAIILARRPAKEPR
jgi:hypothetical protein